MSAPAADLVVLAGGLSHERDVSLRSGRRLSDALRAAGASVRELDTDARLLPTLADTPPDAVLIALHGTAGEDGALRQVLELVGVPYVGAGPQACRSSFDKPTAKSFVAAAGLAVAPSVALPHDTFRELGAPAVLRALLAQLGLPLMVKPARGGSSLGAVVVRDAAELPNAMVSCFSYDDTALVEQYVNGVEVAVTVLETPTGLRALPAVEVVPVHGVFDYAARYTAGETEYYVPARLAEEVAEAVGAAAISAHRALGLRHLSRSDLIVQDDGTPVFLEVNVAPGMTETSLLPMALEAAGLDLGEVMLELAQRAQLAGGPTGR